MSLGNSLLIPQPSGHPLLATISGNNYANAQPRSRGSQRYPKQHHFYKPPFRPLAAAGTSLHDVYTSSGHSGFEQEPSSSGYEHHNYPPSPPHGHTAPSGTGYAAPQAPSWPSLLNFGKPKKGDNSALTALTLLSFFAFVNLLQTCLKEHMTAMNPTVMVMTTGVLRNRHNKLAEMNSREQSSTSPTSISSVSNGQIVVQPEDLISAAASISSATVAPTVLLQSPYSSVGQHNKPPSDHQPNADVISNNGNSYQHSSYPGNYNDDTNPYASVASISRPDANPYDSYPNRSYSSSSSDRYPHRHPHYHTNDYRYNSPTQHTSSDAYPWSYESSYPTSSPTYNQHNSPHSSSSLSSASSSWSYGGHVNDNNYFERDRYGDSYYMRIN